MHGSTRGGGGGVDGVEHIQNGRRPGGAGRSFPALFVRGGTSNGLVILREHLPPASEWPSVLASAMGSPDGNGRQLDGMGSGLSSTSKICVLSASSRPDSDVEFTFVQVGIRDGSLDMAGNCGNMSSIIGPVSLDEGLVEDPRILEEAASDSCSHPDDMARTASTATATATTTTTALVRIYNTNTAKLIHARFPVTGDPPRYYAKGDYAMDGVPGTGSKIVLSFLSPGGAKTGQTLPTGNPVNNLTLSDGSTIQASLVDVSNPGVFVRASDVVPDSLGGLDKLDPAAVEANPALKARLEQIRRAGAARIGLDPNTESVPKIVVVFPPSPARKNPGINIQCLALSMGQAHKAVPLTLALCLGAAALLPGTIPCELALVAAAKGGVITIGHPSGSLDVSTTIRDGHVLSAELHRTARVLMRGDVFYQ
ncbi:hypothetical protein B0T26DRAFT_647279 [Lasiosphaeria miniovina]|uniref:Methylitaconate delta2-delta3-isomerase n=1 Tax=Lasiosphaeria miniovina TaxID=1954250 RepID=A0AA40AM25_9PEZI|nr:uncharacterized protein B0T26DRAFT_647279 [Lasiosphaeria miniovina]KAK0718348.1 hypothetical protein B0T26DRAFT_647279 [Lasiosphaeria miniovina]